MLGEAGYCFWYLFRETDVVQIRAWNERHMWDQESEPPTELMGALNGLGNAVEVGGCDVADLMHSMLPLLHGPLQGMKFSSSKQQASD